MNTPADTDSKPWYKQPLLWLVIFFPAATVVAGFITLAIAIKTDDGVVVDDYYKKGKEINRVLTRDKAAARIGLTGDVRYLPDARELEIKITSSKGATLSDKVRLQLLHSTRGGIDVDQAMTNHGDGNYRLSLDEPLALGGWIVQISTPEWRIHGRLAVPDNYRSPLAPL